MNEAYVRIFTADGSGAGEYIADALRDTDATVAALVSISPADACTVATKLSLRYAVQCWDAHHEGKAIFWKPALALQGLYRTEFQRLDREPALAPRGLLRATVMWDGRPLHVVCAQLASDDEAAWQIAQVARELSALRGPAIVAIDPGCARGPAWTEFNDAWRDARWRSISLAEGIDVGDAARAAFGVGVDARPPEAAAAVAPPGGSLRLLCSKHFTVVHANRRAMYGPASQYSPLAAEIAPVANGSAHSAIDDSDAVTPGRGAGSVR